MMPSFLSGVRSQTRESTVPGIKGLQHAHGDWICFLGADDYLLDASVLERCLAASHVHPEVRVIYEQVALVAEDGRMIRKIGSPWEQEEHR